MSTHIYMFVREDISPEQKIVQCSHAAHEAGKLEKGTDISSLVLLSVADEDELKKIAMRLDMLGINFYMFFEPDNEMGYSALCTCPVTESERKHFKKYKLFRV